MLIRLLPFALTVRIAVAIIEWYKSDPDVGLNTGQLIIKYGYPFENHTVQTEDGYILELHRIPYSRDNVINSNRSAVLVVPGILADSSIWVNMGRKNSLGFLLADEGYDVWLANYRGTTWSRKHITLNPDVDKKQFWDFSFHEIGIYDLPAFIDYILNVTNQNKLFYIGHSQGTTSIFALLSVKPEYNNKIHLAAMLAPVAYVNYVTESAIVAVFPLTGLATKFVEISQHYEFLRHNDLNTIEKDITCRDGSPFQDMCVVILDISFGALHINKTRLPVIYSNFPAGISFKQCLHYYQSYRSKSFQQFDYGPIENAIKYNQLIPPPYNLSKATAPFALYYGDGDLISVQKNVERIALQLPRVVVKSMLQNFTHVDFVWGIDVVNLLYKNVFNLMQNYQRLL